MSPATELLSGLLVGVIVCVIVFGVTTIQAALYYCRFGLDPTVLKCGVAVLMAIQMLQVSSMSSLLYSYCVTSHAHPAVLFQVRWELIASQITSASSSATVQLYFAKRAFQRVTSLSRSIILASCIILLALAEYGSGIVVAFTRYKTLGSTSATASVIYGIPLLYASSNTAADILIASSMIFYLMKRRTGIKRTDRLITRLTLYSLSTGLVTSFLSAVMTAVILARTPSIVLLFGVPYAGIHTCVLLCNLHARSHLQDLVRHDIPLQLVGEFQSQATVVTVTQEEYEESIHNGTAEIELHSRLQKLFPDIEESCSYPTPQNEGRSGQ